MYIDSHCHLNMLNLEAYPGGLGELIEKAKLAGVTHMLCVGVDLVHAQEVIDIAEQFDNVSASVGIHPSEKCEIEPTAADIIALAEHPKVIAIGEMGLDYYYNDTGLEQMRERFRMQIGVAKKLNKPIIVHTRDAREDTIQIMQEEGAEQCGGVMHCFTETWEMAEQALALGFYVSFSGIVTFKNAKNVADLAQKVPLERMLIETDAPYLTPAPYRGRPNTPEYVPYVAEKIAELKAMSVAEVAQQTTENFNKLFNM